MDRKSEDTKHRTEWCAEANKYRCMRFGRGSKYMRMPGKCTRPKYLSEKLKKWGKRHRFSKMAEVLPRSQTIEN